MKRLILLLALTGLLPSCAALDSAKWTVGTSYNPTTKQVEFNIGKEPISAK